MAINRHAPNILAREQRWNEKVTAQLPELLTRLLDSPIYGVAPGRPLPPEKYGVYLFTKGGRPLYVGRVGLTERSRRAGRRFSNFRTRLRGHTRARHSEGTYAYARTVRHFRRNGLELAET